MTLYELMNNTTIQGDVKIRVFKDDGNYDEVAMKRFGCVDDLSYEEIPEEWEDLEVRYLYYADNCITIELYIKEDE